MEEEDPHDWKVPIKKIMNEDVEDDSIDHEDRQILEQIEEDELLFREKGPKSQGSRINVDRDKDGRRMGK
jgi:hypothetical protein